MHRPILAALLLLLAWTPPAPVDAQEKPAQPQDNEPRELVVAYSPKQLTLDPVHIYTTME